MYIRTMYVFTHIMYTVMNYIYNMGSMLTVYSHVSPILHYAVTKKDINISGPQLIHRVIWLSEVLTPEMID